MALIRPAGTFSREEKGLRNQGPGAPVITISSTACRENEGQPPAASDPHRNSIRIPDHAFIREA
jgi:hypothetical protein